MRRMFCVALSGPLNKRTVRYSGLPIIPHKRKIECAAGLSIVTGSILYIHFKYISHCCPIFPYPVAKTNPGTVKSIIEDALEYVIARQQELSSYQYTCTHRSPRWRFYSTNGAKSHQPVKVFQALPDQPFEEFSIPIL